MNYAGFISGAYTIQSISANNQKCVNLYPQQDESGAGKNSAYLFSTPGLLRVADLTASKGPSRCTYTSSKGRLFEVVGSTLYELDSTFAAIGNYPLPGETGTGPVSMTDNGSDMMILTGPNGYWFHFADNGSIATLAITSPGIGWVVGDTFDIGGVGSGGTGIVTAVAAGVPTAITLGSIGSDYVDAGGLPTTAQLPSTGTGLTVSVTILDANTPTQITDDVFEGGTQCGFIDGYIVFNQPGTQKFWITNLYSTVINPLGFASAEGQPDVLLGLLVDHRFIWLFSSTHIEVWYDSGNPNFPFAYIQGAYISHGIASPWASSRLDNTVFWIGQDEFGTAIAWRANGYSPLRISTYAMEQAWQRYPQQASDCIAWTYQQDGHSFWVLNFPSGDATWAYDAATGLWHERGYLGTLAADDGQLHRGRPINHAFAFGKHIVGDWETGYVYQLSALIADDDGREIQRLRRAPVIDSFLKRIFFYQFQLDMEVGQGNPESTEPVNPPAEPVEPQILLRWSNDGGNTWSNYYAQSMGKSGNYTKRVIWRRLGKSRQRIFEVSTGQNNVNLALYNAYLELEGTNS